MRKGERGFSLVEVLIALAVLGIIAATFMTSLSVSGNSVIITDESATAESIARSQLEFIREYQYIDAPVGEDRNYSELAGFEEFELQVQEEHPNYSIWSFNRNEEIVENIMGVAWNSESNTPRSADIGLQRIKLAIKHNDKVVLVLETYKVRR